MIEIDHLIARQRQETSQIALNTVAQKGEAHAQLRRAGVPQLQQEPAFEEDEEIVAFSRLGDELDLTLS